MNALQAEIIAALKTQPTIDPAKEIRRSVDFMKAYLKKNTFLKSYVLGISGGQDSTLVGALAEKAMQEMRAETGDESYQFIAVRLPYGEQADESDAMAAIEFMAADQVKRVNIKGSVDAMVQSLAETGVIVSDFNKGNIKARVRMIAQYGVAGENSGAVLGTDHSAESITGFYTKFGDGGADLVPIFRLNKRQGKAMLAELGAPKHLYEKVPTADLEEDRPALPDELALGVTYDQIDDYLEGRQVNEEAATKIENWYKKTAHKRHLPITIYDTFWQ
ncbi:ammonia-dependent NAD(+) synthetase [Latilactobacillus sakei]|uniref:ammonia-dependent NAD(+) synthetase n=1 Tax=Latilactobacillus sakei TaxID=1599 RepID=UPI00077CC817|nr:ammonia-dependent NAD(+) synthetase [Latilactobacillus sakei]AWZ42060.1 ammonia-dependent NAD(+) synthetase [Latilactobacillus sakei]MDM5043580.1 ammonia-dependent NAD(+) synthetase [Latilactobacillus sakei]QGL60198.1 ammonia-dependent NAD(+) synthetase [Latilactobacillus sakei]USS38384.1 ammonia-dependent NAD(+) synthetase [Latilactobacillus sakei]WEY50078.1 ammonia-dependent NAD(+) synthetase [Latilactobacillus sakei]